MSTYKELMAQNVELQKKISEARKIEMTAAIARILDLVNEFELTAKDIFPNKAGRPIKPLGVASAMYRNPDNHLQTWTGRGRVPGWMVDTPKAERSKFMI